MQCNFSDPAPVSSTHIQTKKLGFECFGIKGPKLKFNPMQQTGNWMGMLVSIAPHRHAFLLVKQDTAGEIL